MITRRVLIQIAAQVFFTEYEKRKKEESLKKLLSPRSSIADKIDFTLSEFKIPGVPPIPELPDFSRTPPITEVKPAVKTHNIELPNTQETASELKRRLGKELYRLELDLQGGGRIAGKPCDCLGKKHNLGIEATAEELMSYENNPAYGQTVNWINTHAVEFEPEEIAKRPPEYYQGLVKEVRDLRKSVMGTEKITALLG